MKNGGDVQRVNGNISILIDEFARTMSLEGAMRAAGFCGRGMTREAMRAIEENGEAVRAAIINYTAGADTDLSEDAALRCRRRIIREYERIAFSDDDTVKIADKLRALAEYRQLCELGASPVRLVVNYDYGGGDDRDDG